jgi:hypothetical protein
MAGVSQAFAPQSWEKYRVKWGGPHTECADGLVAAFGPGQLLGPV